MKIEIDTSKINTREDFHKYFQDLMGFPEFYGKNMDAWIDCMSSLRSPEDGMTKISLASNEIMVFELTDWEAFKKRCPDIYVDLIECSFFVNKRFMSRNEQPVIAFSLL